MEQVQRAGYSNQAEAQALTLFNMFDTDKSGTLSTNEAEYALSNMGFSASEISEIFMEADKNFDGELSFEEFKEAVAPILYERMEFVPKKDDAFREGVLVYETPPVSDTDKAEEEIEVAKPDEEKKDDESFHSHEFLMQPAANEAGVHIYTYAARVYLLRRPQSNYIHVAGVYIDKTQVYIWIYKVDIE